MTTVLITGNTYPVKDRIKALGGTWNKLMKGWDVSAAHADEIRAMVEGAGPSTYVPRQAPRASRYGSNYFRTSSGYESFQNKRGRCEDAPCCGCCS